jgi:alpha-L-rhamnosidase
MPLVLDVAPADRRQLIQSQLVASIAHAGNHLTTGFVGTPFLLTGLSDLGLGELAWTIVTQSNAPGWFDIVFHHKSSTFMEFWNAAGVQMPSCQGPIGEWFIRDLGGVQLDPSVPDFKHIILRPTPVGSLEWVRATHASAYGQIVSRWQKRAGQLTWDVTIPANASATIYLPTSAAASVTEFGRPVAGAEGVAILPPEAGCAVYEIGAGNYHFSARCPK